MSALTAELFAENPAAVAEGKGLEPGRRAAFKSKRKWFASKSAA